MSETVIFDRTWAKRNGYYVATNGDCTPSSGEWTRILDALAASQAETADWKANAQRENALLVQAQQRIAELEGAIPALREVARLFEHYQTVPCLSDLLGEDSDYGCECAGCMARKWMTAHSAALGRMLKGVADAPMSSSPQAQNTEGGNG